MAVRLPATPLERDETPRRAIERCLAEGPHTARDLAERLRLREREVVEHLEHVQRSLRAAGRRLAVEPAACRGCGYTFPGRRRLSRPSACPRCRSERIEPPVFAVEDA